MYNRYIRNDQGGYTRVPEQEAPRSTQPSGERSGADPPPGSKHEHHAGESPLHAEPPPHRHEPVCSDYENADATAGSGLSDGLTGFLRHMLDQLHLDSVDTGDLLLLGLLFFLFREDADEELLIALGLLLIL